MPTNLWTDDCDDWYIELVLNIIILIYYTF